MQKITTTWKETAYIKKKNTIANGFGTKRYVVYTYIRAPGTSRRQRTPVTNQTSGRREKHNY